MSKSDSEQLAKLQYDYAITHNISVCAEVPAGRVSLQGLFKQWLLFLSFFWSRTTMDTSAFDGCGPHHLDNLLLVHLTFRKNSIVMQTDHLFDTQFYVELREFRIDPTLTIAEICRSRVAIGQLTVVDPANLSKYRVVNLSMNRYAPVHAIVQKSKSADDEKLACLGRGAVYCSTRELEEAYERLAERLLAEFAFTSEFGDETSKTSKEVWDFLDDICGKLRAPYSSVISMPSPVYLNTHPRNVNFFPRPSLQFTPA